MQPNETVIHDLSQQIMAAVHPLRIILFGSAATRQVHAHSDIDLVVVMPEGVHRRRTAQLLYRTIHGVQVPFDLIVTTPGDLERHRDNPGLIYYAIARQGRTIYVASAD
jgi:predicted nucleotidyltransferase